MPSMTLFEWVTQFGGICGAIVTIVGLLVMAAKPFKTQNERIEKLETHIGGISRDVEQIKIDLDHAFDKERDLEQVTRTTQRALLALLNHSLYGNNTKEMEEAKKDLQEQIWRGDN